jgi:hypothetical protein
MPETKIRITDWVKTPDGIGQVSMFEKNGSGETMVKVYLEQSHNIARWYKLTEINL